MLGVHTEKLITAVHPCRPGVLGNLSPSGPEREQQTDHAILQVRNELNSMCCSPLQMVKRPELVVGGALQTSLRPEASKHEAKRKANSCRPPCC